MRILVAEDDPIARKMLVRTLTEVGHQVTSAEDGEKAWEMFQADPVPVVVTDWQMPKMSGIDLCKAIRAAKLLPYTGVVVVTSLSAHERLVEAYRSGVDDFLAKPVDPDDLHRRLAAIERAMSSQTEWALRQVVERTQEAGNGEALLDALSGLARMYRERRAYVRCRAFLRRQIEIADQSYGADDERTKRLRAELDEIRDLEELSGGLTPS